MEYLVCRMEKGADQGPIKNTVKCSTASSAKDGACGFVGALMCLAGWYLQLHSHIVVREHTARVLKFFPPQYPEGYDRNNEQFLSTYHLPGTVLKALRMFLHLILATTLVFKSLFSFSFYR